MAPCVAAPSNLPLACEASSRREKADSDPPLLPLLVATKVIWSSSSSGMLLCSYGAVPPGAWCGKLWPRGEDSRSSEVLSLKQHI